MKNVVSGSIISFVAFALYGQNGSTLVGVGYGLPSTPAISPGQVVKLQLTGLPVLSEGGYFHEAATLPLPLSLAGIAVAIEQDMANSSISTTFDVPILSVEQTPVCLTLDPECFITLVTVQIPFELVPFSPPTRNPSMIPPFTWLVIKQNETESERFILLIAREDAIHVANSCDFVSPIDISPTQCQSLVTHSDGSAVTSASPAKPGETILVRAYGLGKTTPIVKTGEPTPAPAPVLSRNTIFLDFDFRPNAMPSRPLLSPLGQAITPTLVSLVPGELGVYEVPVELPARFPTMFNCVGIVRSNLTINIAGAFSFDGAQICVSGSDSKR